MESSEQKVLRWWQASKPLRPAAVDEAVDAYRDRLGASTPPAEADARAAVDAASATVERRVLSDDWLSAILARPLEESEAAALRMRFREARPALRIPSSEPALELPLWRLAAAAATGALLGMLILTPLTRLLLGMRDVGILLGAPLGAALAVSAIRTAARSKWLRRGLMAALGAATVAEVWAMLSSAGVLGRLRRLMGGRGSALKRIALYFAATFVLVFARPRSRWNRAHQEQLARDAIEQWLDGAVLLMGFLAERGGRDRDGDSSEVLANLAQKALLLKQVPAADLPAAVDELRQELRNLGFEAEAGPPGTLQWDESCRERYETFGLVSPGDPVLVEREPVVFRGQVRRKGLVRRVRERT